MADRECSGLPPGWSWVLLLPFALLALSAVAGYFVLTGRAHRHAGRLPPALEWSPLLGATLLLAAWLLHLLG